MPAADKIDLSSLPEDQRDVVADLLREHADLLATNAALKAKATDLKQIVKRLEHLVAELNHVVHGKKSEKLSEDDRSSPSRTWRRQSPTWKRSTMIGQLRANRRAGRSRPRSATVETCRRTCLVLNR